MIEHFYLCSFQIYKDGNKKSRPHIRPRYIKAGNADKAYRKAQLVCNSDRLTHSAADIVVCRKKNIKPSLIENARREITCNPDLLIDVKLQES